MMPMGTLTSATSTYPIACMLGVGLVFELPVPIFLLTLLRVASPRLLMRNSRYAILAIVIAGRHHPHAHTGRLQPDAVRHPSGAPSPGPAPRRQANPLETRTTDLGVCYALDLAHGRPYYPQAR